MRRAQINPVKGTRDFYPEEMARRVWLYERIRAVGRRFGYQEYEGPALEPIALYAAKSGDELVKEQAFVLTDRGGDELALRPELTPTLARMIARRQGRLSPPVRWWSFGPFWRYERPQRGRTREFLQWNIDLLGVEGAEADAEMVAIAVEFFRETGLDDGSVVVQVNSRPLMEKALAAAGIAGEARQAAFKLIDKREKLPPGEWREYAGTLGFDAGRVEALASLLENRDLWRESEDLVSLFGALESYGVRGEVEFEPSVIRGLDYYTGTVFEARDRDGEFRAILGGGRYDDLVADVGGDRVPGVGFAMGDVVVSLVLEKYGKMPEIRPVPTRVLVTRFSPESLAPAIRIASAFRRAGIETELYPSPAKMAKQFRYADQQGIPYAVVIGPDEEAAGTVALKELSSGAQETLRPEEAIERLRG